MSKSTLSIKSYTIGFTLSLLLTIVPYLLVTKTLLSGNTLLFWLAIFAVTQVLVQLIFFMHIGSEQKPRLQALSFVAMITVVVIVVFGSLWIMNSMHYNMMPGDKVDTYIQEEEAIRINE